MLILCISLWLCISLVFTIYRHNLLFFPIGLIPTLIAIGFSYVNTYELESWNFKILYLTHEEQWTEQYYRTETYACGTDSKGNVQYCTRLVSDTRTLGPYWTSVDEYGTKHRISQKTYNEWKRLWNNEYQSGVHIGSSALGDFSKTGKIYRTDWTRKFKHIYPYSKLHKYVNKIRHSDTVFNQSKYSKIYGEYPHPVSKKNTDALIAYGAQPINPVDNYRLKQLNANLGKKHQIHIITFFVDDIQFARNLVESWGGVNKNELCVFLKIDPSDKITNVYISSWSDDTTIHSQIRSKLLNQQYNVWTLVEEYTDSVDKYWKRKSFKDFEYLQTYSSLDYIITAVMLGGVLAAINMCFYNFVLKKVQNESFTSNGWI